MHSEDHIKSQVDELGRVLAKLLADVLGVSSQSQSGGGVEVVEHGLENALGLPLDGLCAMDDGAMEQWLGDHQSLDAANVELLADLLARVAVGSSDGRRLHETALRLYRGIDKRGETYSIDRQAKIRRIEEAPGSYSQL